MSQRALRRHHRRRLLNKRKAYWDGVYLEKYDCEIRITKIQRLINTPTPCSCWMCGNPRKHWKEKTRKELIWEVKMKEGLVKVDFF